LTTMRAVVITSPGGPEVLQIEERPAAEPSRGEIRVRVAASGLNRADISQRLGRYPAPLGSPADIPGLEYAGEVESCGPDATLWSPGDRVMGIVGGGGHAEYVTVHEREAMPVPANLTWEEAAAVPEVFLTAYDALFSRLRVAAGETLLIHAVGSGVGTAALQLASVAGVRTIGTSRSHGKLEAATALGLDEAVNTARDDWEQEVSRVAGPVGIHAILDLVGGKFFAANLKLLATRGRLVVVGLTAGAASEIDLRLLLRKRLRVEGTVLRARPLEEKIELAREFSDRMLGFFETRKLKPVVHSVLSFEDIRDAHQEMEADLNFGKIVLRW
jgi:NADPH2:quinone reductase